jgi:hypothetical protein
MARWGLVFTAQVVDLVGQNTALFPPPATGQLSASELISGVTTVQVADGNQVAPTDLVSANTLGEYTVNVEISVGLAKPTMVQVRNAAGTWSGGRLSPVFLPPGSRALRQAGALRRSTTERHDTRRAQTLLGRAHCALGVVYEPGRAAAC